MAAYNQDGITIGTISGGIVNFGGAVTIAPISITKTSSGSSSDNHGGTRTTSSGSSSSSRTGSDNSGGSSFTDTSLSGILEIIRRV
ncbi:hypothetical protein COJ85_03050 [Bacillus sp. AFS076308]|uniref:hypothetical protein n=1 Tax=unclassified Bacillus (in: firmicutes) TaxID=185979 RepID=UPI000BF82B2D|nr:MULTISPECIES: hypothetical protein [unclassified Bacillus (in: firmicutes)]PFO08484.1 hypothetical protein COJ85_03050 [Bacillus sp. AFS076308]PGV54703.1 hypothetical protein COD92_04070 [Bacillus sp. AFS037270]